MESSILLLKYFLQKNTYCMQVINICLQYFKSVYIYIYLQIYHKLISDIKI